MSEGSPDRRTDPRLERDLDTLRVIERPDPLGAVSRRRRRRWPWLLALGFVAVAAAAFSLHARLTAPPEVALVAVTLRDFGAPPTVLTASGYVEARRQITVSSKAQGKILEMPVDENDRVRAGDLIATIENDEHRASLQLAEAEFRDAEREFRRKQSLYARGSVSRFELDRATTAFEVAEARLALARVSLDNTTLRAPIDGTVIRKIRDVGEFLTIGVTAEGDPGTAVVTLADLSAIDVALEIGETEIRLIHAGGVALVTPEAMRDRRYLADVTEVAAMADRQKGVVPVRVRIRAPDRDLLPDMTATVTFLEAEPAGDIEVLPSVPIEAVVRRDGREVVFVAEDEKVRVVPVRVREDDEHAAILEGPGEGTYVVEAPPEKLQDGATVSVPTT